MTRIFIICMLMLFSKSVFAACPDYLNIDVQKLHSKEKINICENFGNKPMLIVNTASHCGFTPQFEGLEALYKKYKNRDFIVLGFPSDTFKQEANNEKETADVCYINYGVTFQMFSTVAVRGDDAHPIFKELARQSKAPKWNFNKYLLDKNGNVIEHFGSLTKPDNEKLIEKIENLL